MVGEPKQYDALDKNIHFYHWYYLVQPLFLQELSELSLEVK